MCFQGIDVVTEVLEGDSLFTYDPYLWLRGEIRVTDWNLKTGWSQERNGRYRDGNRRDPCHSENRKDKKNEISIMSLIDG